MLNNEKNNLNCEYTYLPVTKSDTIITFCNWLQSIDFDIDYLNNSAVKKYAQADINFLPFAIYSLRWSIEVDYKGVL